MKSKYHPYPVNARVRVGYANARWGSIVGIVPAPHEGFPDYVVQFDSLDALRGESVAPERVSHFEIAICFAHFAPAVQVLVGAETYTRFHAESANADFEAGAYKSVAKAKKQAPQCEPVLWREHYWVVNGGAWCMNLDDNTDEMTYLEIEMVVPRAEWDGEIVTPSYENASHYGYLLMAQSGEYVATGVVAVIARLGPLVWRGESVVPERADAAKPRVPKKSADAAASADLAATMQPALL